MHIDPGRLWQNAYGESFNGKFLPPSAFKTAWEASHPPSGQCLGQRWTAERGAVLAKNSLEYVLLYYGASPIAEPTLRRAIEVFRCDFIQGYGMTETTAGIALLLPADHQRGLTDKPALLRSAGRPMLGTEVRIVDAQDTPMLPGTIGEIVARGPQLMKGY